MTQHQLYKHTRCINCFSTDTLTEEHVFADGAGGHITAYILCKNCNGHFGANIDSPYLKQPIVELARNSLRIGGRRRVIPQPLKGPYTVDGPAGEATIQLDVDFKPRVMTQVQDIQILEDGGLALRMVIDAKDREKIPGIVRSKYERFFKSEVGAALGWSEVEQEKAIKDTIDGYMSAPDKETPTGKLSKSITTNGGTLFLEAAKVAFEIAAIEDGLEFVESARADKFRELFKRVEKGEIKDIPTFKQMLLAFNAAEISPDSPIARGIEWMTQGKAHENHVAILNGAHVIVSMFGFAYLFIELRKKAGRDVFYTNNARTGDVRVERA
ncbi:HNH endonuclease [Stenotrophomonas sepilia]